LKWDKNKGTKGYLWLIIDDAGVLGVLRRDVRHWFIRVPSDGGWTGAAATLEGATGAWTGAAADAPAANAPVATLEAATGAWTGAAADAPAAMLEAATGA
jgi:hypothetical protein